MSFNFLCCISFHIKQVLTWSTNVYTCQHAGQSGELILCHAMNHDLKEREERLTSYKVQGFGIVFEWFTR